MTKIQDEAGREAESHLKSVGDWIRWAASRFTEAGLYFGHGTDNAWDEATALIKERGGKVSGSVSKNTDYVLVGEDPGSKYGKAKELGIKMLSEEQFRKMI